MASFTPTSPMPNPHVTRLLWRLLRDLCVAVADAVAERTLPKPKR